jgi:hypothetical protein
MDERPATREEIRQIAAQEEWTLHHLGDMDVFIANHEGGVPLPPMTFLWRGDKKYRPRGGHEDWDWIEDTLSAGEVAERMCAFLYTYCHGFSMRIYDPATGRTALRSW